LVKLRLLKITTAVRFIIADAQWSKKMNQPGQNLAKKLVEAWNTHDLDYIASFYAPEFLGEDVGLAHPQRGPTGIKQVIQDYFDAFPDLYFTCQNIIQQGRQVAIFWLAEGTHQGILMKIPPTQRKVRVQGVSLLAIHENKIIRARQIWDVAGLLRAVGLLPEL
jgi:steroid delta-isomerase-like uncharacterized protein